MTKTSPGAPEGHEAEIVRRRVGVDELRFSGTESSSSYVREPEGNGCAERIARLLDEQLLLPSLSAATRTKEAKVMRTAIALPVLACLSMFLPAGVVLAEEPVYGQMELNYYPENPVWRGTITGDISGDMFFTNVGPGRRGEEIRGGTISFEEEWLITDEDGNLLLTGTDQGIVSPNSKYRMNGVVTDAAQPWSHLIGRTVHMSGYITWDPETGLPLTAPGTFRVD